MPDSPESREASDSSHAPLAPTALLSRRPPAHQSVSLLHPKSPSSEDDLSDQPRGRRPSSNRPELGSAASSLPPGKGQHAGSGQSSNAERWFEKSNNNVRTGSADLMDNDPPFFLRNSSSEETSPDNIAERERPEQQSLGSLPNEVRLMQLATAASNSEDFRSVIDDLTIQNKRLKRRLKKYERQTDARLQNEKLFEIRFHGLPSVKRRELEDYLSRFAAGLSTIAHGSSSGMTSENQTSRSGPVRPSLEQRITASSMGNVDSAYASASGQQSSAMSGMGSGSGMHASKKEPKSSAMWIAQQRYIQKFLSDIPLGLLPKPVAMTEKAKRRLVVRRLEQLFAGKGASRNGYQQPNQQEEISQSAAQADRTARVARGGKVNEEGAREARIMSFHKRRIAKNPEAGAQIDAEEVQVEPPAVVTRDFSKLNMALGTSSPDQRPTRPLDLDPNRAQVPEDNIKYLRHLGFSPNSPGSAEELIDGHGFMYLNVLINMAQLHTLNVTPEFVKKSIELYSEKLELSTDGRKVRWKGGDEVTWASSSASPDDNGGAHGQAPSGASGRNTGALQSLSGDGSSGAASKSSRRQKEPVKKVGYVPLFFRKQEDEETEFSDDMSDWSSREQEMPAADSSGLTSSNVRTSSSKKRPCTDGPLIFYNNAPFMTDLSGDIRGTGPIPMTIRNYPTMMMPMAGISPENEERADGISTKGPLSKPLVSRHNSDESSDGRASTESIHGFSKPASMKTTGSSSEESPDPMDFEASGLGGVHPSDNFAIHIRSRHHISQEEPGPEFRDRTRNYPPHIRAIIAADRAAQAPSTGRAPKNVTAEVLSEKRRELPASRLPPPSFFPLDGYDEDCMTDSEDEDDDSDVSSSLPEPQPLPSAPMVIARWPSNSASKSDDERSDGDLDMDDDVDDDDDDDDGSPDMLAHARKIDPEQIRIAEREFDADVAERLAEEIPAGSSAATAGGGSGFNTPMDADFKGASVGKSVGITPERKAAGVKRARGASAGKPARSSKSPRGASP